MALRSISLLALGIAVPALAQPPAPDTIEVIGTPLGAPIDADRLAQNVQTASAEEIRARGALDLADFMRRGLASVFVNDAQNNPLQPDVQYRGFVGSPLLGLPQGLAVYQDGVRANEPFGDTVSWALIPQQAIEHAYLVPGANPLFGLNALGGAIAIRTKSGRTSPGLGFDLSTGSFGRTDLEAQVGGTARNLDYYLTGRRLTEDGWRDFSPTEATQLFGKLGWEVGETAIDASLTYADTDLIGNGAAPAALLELDREAIFTRPDQTKNELALFNVVARRAVSDTLDFAANVYLRQSDIRSLNGDDSDFEECENDPGFICEEDDGEEELTLDANGAPIGADESLEGATVNRTRTDQSSKGFGFQMTSTAPFAGRPNQLVAGIGYDTSDIDFAASTELGTLDATRLAIPGGVFVGESFTALHAETSNLGLFVSNAFELARGVVLTASARYNRTNVALEDRLGTQLNGDHDFDRINPAVGLTYAATPAVTLYASYSEANRAPSPVELTCADPDDPCRLPNAFLADPPLEQVVAKTFEAGVRGGWDRGRWSAGVFRTTNEDDILFVSAGALTNEGYFTNVGRTRRDGVELNAAGNVGERLAWSASYTHLDATFRTALSVPSANHPLNVDGEIAVEAGDRLPLTPRHLLKGGVIFTASDRLTVGADVLASSSQHFRGDEGNVFDEIDGYALLNLRGEYRVADGVRVYLAIDNVLDTQFETFGLFGEADEVLGDDFEDPAFLGPGAPRAAWIGVQVSF